MGLQSNIDDDLDMIVGPKYRTIALLGLILIKLTVFASPIIFSIWSLYSLSGVVDRNVLITICTISTAFGIWFFFRHVEITIRENDDPA